jgi:hypothetical protein
MTELEKIEAFVNSIKIRTDAEYIIVDDIIDYIQTLKAEKPQPDEGKMAWEVLKELADWRKIVSLDGGVATTQRYEWAEAIKKEINQVQAKYKEELTNKEEK